MATSPTITPDDPRLQQCGFAKLQGEGIEHVMRKYEVTLGRKSKSKSADVVLGDTMSVSREHAIIRYNFDEKRFELEVLGKNGMHVDGESVGAGGVVPLRSRAKLRAADACFHFLLPRDPAARPLRRRKLKRSEPAAPAQPAAAAPAAPAAAATSSAQAASPAPPMQPTAAAAVPAPALPAAAIAHLPAAAAPPAPAAAPAVATAAPAAPAQQQPETTQQVKQTQTQLPQLAPQPPAAPAPVPAAAPAAAAPAAAPAAVPPAATGAQALLAQLNTVGDATVSVAALMQNPEILQQMLAAAQPTGAPPQGQAAAPTHATLEQLQQQPGWQQ